MKLIAGLGNPGRRYEGSRHNAGYALVDELARRWKIDLSRYDRDFEGLIGEGQVGGEPVKLLKPTTLMNLSGRSVGAVARFYKLPLPDLLVACDDMDFPVGTIRLRRSGSSAGQRGLEDVIRQLGTDEFARLRIGIGKVDKFAAVEFVLGRFEGEEREAIEFAIQRAADAAERWVRSGIEAAMNEFNRKDSDRTRGRERQKDAAGPADPETEGESS